MQLIRSRRGVAFFVLIGLGAVAVACSASSSSVGFGSAGPSAGVSTGPFGGVVQPPCPGSLPASGSVCESNDLVCEYGVYAEESCNDVATCSSSKWRIARGSGSCTPGCPATFDDLEPGGACPETGVTCTYDEATCGCLRGSPSAEGDAGDDAGDDAGSPTPGAWTCIQAKAGCPGRRPAAGSPCVDDMDCDYGSCLFGQPLLFRCLSKSWELGAPSCP